MWQMRQSHRGEWQTYTDIESAIIEDVYQKGGDRVELENNVVIDLKQWLQIDTGKKSDIKIIEVRRLSTDSDDAKAFRRRNQRNDRFCSVPKMVTDINSSSSLGAGNWNGSRFVFEWQMKCPNLETLSYGEIMHQALDGIRFESTQMGHKKEADWIANYVMPVTKQSFESICQTCIRLYTMESFIYRLLNIALRDNDFSKVDTLGPLSYILFQFNFASEFQNLRFSGRVYRGAELTPAMINEYKCALGSVRSWLGFTSTSKQRQIAESFVRSTTLFIIDIGESASDAARTIASLSTYPHEDEVLIRAGRHFTIDKIESTNSPNSSINTLIYLSME